MPYLSSLLQFPLGPFILADFLFPLGIFLGALILFWIFQHLILQRLQIFSAKTKTDLDDIFTALIAHIPASFFFITSLFIAWQWSPWTHPTVDFLIKTLFTIFITWQAIKIIQKIIQLAFERLWGKNKTESAQNQTALQGLSLITKIILWSAGLLFVLSNLGINITAFVASLGIGGIAIAFALQNVLGDLFNSFAIFFDKPFQLGDFIQVGTDSGTVKKIGLKTTRLESLRGEQIIISNTDLTASRIQNFRRMKQRRSVFQIGVTYNTSHSKLQQIPDIIKQIIIKNHAEPDRIHFAEFGDSALIFEIAFFVPSPSLKETMDFQAKINLDIVKAFQKAKIEFAFPTQTIYLQK